MRTRLTGAAAVAAGIGAAGALFVVAARCLVARQAATARQRIGKPLGEEAIASDRVWRSGRPGEPVNLLVLGDSLAAGLGAAKRKQTLGGRLARSVARELGRPVRLRTAAVVGSESSDLAAQLDALPADYRPDAAVIVVGGNDVTHRIAVAASVGHLESAVARLRGSGAAVVICTCPDLSALRPVPQPLRRILGAMSRRLARAQRTAALRTGAVPVDLGRAVGPQFLARPDAMFSLDRFHPSPLGYRHTTAALLPAVVGALAAR